MNEKGKELTDRIDEGIDKMRDSNVLRAFLQQVALLHTYSFRNAVLILSKYRNATLLKTYDEWKKNGRYVKLGETGIEIVRPSKSVVRRADGKPVTRIQFLTKTVFDISQTEGKDVQEQRHEPVAGADRYERIYQAIAAASPYKITFEQLRDEQGYYLPDEEKIAIRMGLQDETILQVLFYQIAQAALLQEKREQDERQRKAEAEGIAYLLLGYFQVGVNGTDLRLLSDWYSAAPQDNLVDALESVYSVSQQLLGSIEDAAEKLGKTPVRSAEGTDRSMHDLLSHAIEKSIEIKKQREMSVLENGVSYG